MAQEGFPKVAKKTSCADSTHPRRSWEDRSQESVREGYQETSNKGDWSLFKEEKCLRQILRRVS